MQPSNPPSGLIGADLIRRFFSGSAAEHELLLENLGAPMTRHGGACGWPMETVSRELAKLRGEIGRDR